MKFKTARHAISISAFSFPGPWAAMIVWSVLWGTTLGQVVVDAESSNGKNFTYIIKNEGTVPIASVTIPHHSGIDFSPPEGWEILDDGRSTFASRAKTPESQIRPRSSATFAMTVGLYRGESVRGQGTVEIGLADGTTMQVDNILVPVAASHLEKVAVPVFLLLCFGIFIWRKHRKDKAQVEAAADTP